VFERDNLYIDEGTGLVHDRAYGFRFDHAFSVGPDHRVSAETLDAEYPQERQKFAYLKAKFLRLMGSPQRLLFVVWNADPANVARLAAVIAAAGGPGTSHVLGAAPHSGPTAVMADGDRFAHVLLDAAVRKPQAASWQGDDAVWAALLDPIRLASS